MALTFEFGTKHDRFSLTTFHVLLTHFGLISFGSLPLFFVHGFCAKDLISIRSEFFDEGILVDHFLNFLVSPPLLQRLFGYRHDIKHVAFEFGLIRVFECGQVEWIPPLVGHVLVVDDLLLQLNVLTQDPLQVLVCPFVKTLKFR